MLRSRATTRQPPGAIQGPVGGPGARPGVRGPRVRGRGAVPGPGKLSV